MKREEHAEKEKKRHEEARAVARPAAGRMSVFAMLQEAVQADNDPRAKAEAEAQAAKEAKEAKAEQVSGLPCDRASGWR
jgi:hypothetical protein